MVFQILKMGLIDRLIDRKVAAPCGAFPKDTMHPTLGPKKRGTQEAAFAVPPESRVFVRSIAAKLDKYFETGKARHLVAVWVSAPLRNVPRP